MKKLRGKAYYMVMFIFIIGLIFFTNYEMKKSNMNTNIEKIQLKDSIKSINSNWKCGNEKDGVEIYFYKGSTLKFDKY